MATELVARSQAEPASYTREQLDLLKDTVAKGATDQEFALFVEVCKRKNLDPFAKQIHMVKRWDAELKRKVATYQTGIDGFRLIAERTGQYEGQEGPWWCGADGEWLDVWTGTEPPAAAKVGVFRRNFRQALYAVALYREFLQTNSEGHPNSMWKKMPANQLSKCAEASALRKAFPEELGGLYANEEMGHADNPIPRSAREEPDAPVTYAPSAPPPVPEDEDADVFALWSRMGSNIPKICNTFAYLKRQIEEISGSDTAYYQTLRMYGMEHANDCRTAGMEKTRNAARDLYLTVKRWVAANTPPPADEIADDDVPDNIGSPREKIDA